LYVSALLASLFFYVVYVTLTSVSLAENLLNTSESPSDTSSSFLPGGPEEQLCPEEQLEDEEYCSPEYINNQNAKQN